MHDISIEDILSGTLSSSQYTPTQSSASIGNDLFNNSKDQPSRPHPLLAPFQDKGLPITIQQHTLSPFLKAQSSEKKVQPAKFTLCPLKSTSPQVSRLLVNVKQHMHKQMDHFVNIQANQGVEDQVLRHTHAVSSFFKKKDANKRTKTLSLQPKTNSLQKTVQKNRPLALPQRLRGKFTLRGVVVRGRSVSSQDKPEEEHQFVQMHRSQSVASNDYKLALLRRKQQKEAENIKRVNQIASNIKDNIKNHILFSHSAQQQKVLTLKIKERIRADLELKQYKVKNNHLNERHRVFSQGKQQERVNKKMLTADNCNKQNRSKLSPLPRGNRPKSPKKVKLPSPKHKLVLI